MDDPLRRGEGTLESAPQPGQAGQGGYHLVHQIVEGHQVAYGHGLLRHKIGAQPHAEKKGSGANSR
ncbi:hypothetical protein D3C75_1018370 [compost metagenome]